MRKILVVLFFLWLSPLIGQNYSVDQIPQELRKGAYAVVRESNLTFEIISESEAVYNTKKVVTIFNKEAFDQVIFYSSYDSQRKIDKINISYYNAFGERIKRVKNSEVEDINYTISGSVYDDIRLKQFVPEEYEYPFTVIMEVSYEYEAMVGFPSFRPQTQPKTSVQKASYSISFPNNIGVRYHLMNGISEPKIERDEKTTYYWQVEDLPVRKAEVLGPSIAESAPYVLLGPKRFSMEGYKGDLSTWSGYASWQKELNKGRDALTPEVKSELDELLAGVHSKRERTKLVYEYLQKNTRYVNISLGIGGLQPYSAQSVIANGYGDCKALSNYTYSLLKYAGVPSNYVKIKAGASENEIIPDFPSAQFNHVILAVPMEKDTVWLECTSQITPFNFLGDFTDDRYGLMLTEDGGELVKTPKYDASDSRQIREIEIRVDQEGNAQIKSKSYYTGIQYAQNFWKANSSDKQLREYLIESIDLPSYELVDFSYTDDRSTEDPVLIEELQLRVRNYATISSEKMFLNPNALSKFLLNPPRNKNRESSIIRRQSFQDIDTVKVFLPDNYRFDIRPSDLDEKSSYGHYKVKYDYDKDANAIIYIRELLLLKGKFPKDEYDDFRSFMRKIYRREESRVILSGGI